MNDLKSAAPLRVAVLAGGDSPERAISLESGRAVRRALDEAGARVTAIDPAATPLATVDWTAVDVCFLALHGGAGEDGRVQDELSRLGVAYTGSGPAASRLAMSKSASKERFLQHDVPTLPYVMVHRDERLSDVLNRIGSLGYPLFFKPDGGGSSLGIAAATGPQQVAAAIGASARYDEFVLIEPYVEGRELTVAVWGRQVLPLLEIVAPQGVFDYEAKYHSAATEYRFEPGLSDRMQARVEQAAVGAAAALGTAGMVRVDVLIDRFDCLWVLEVNTLPGMTDHSLVPKAAERAGVAMPELCLRLAREAMNVEVAQ